MFVLFDSQHRPDYKGCFSIVWYSLTFNISRPSAAKELSGFIFFYMRQCLFYAKVLSHHGTKFVLVLAML